MATIIITVVSTTIIGAMAILSNLALYSMYGWQQNLDALFAAESLADDVLLKLVRNPSLTLSPENVLNVGNAQATATIYHAQVSEQPEMIVVTGTSGSYVRKLRITYVIDNSKLQIISRTETK